jgi:hypothetical protein
MEQIVRNVYVDFSVMVQPSCLLIAGTNCSNWYTGMLQTKSAAVVSSMCKQGFYRYHFPDM